MQPAGWVQFAADGTDVGGPVSLDAGGVATTSAAFSANASATVSATFMPTTTAFLASVATDTATVNNAGSQAGSIAISLTVPPAGDFTVSLIPGTVTLAVPDPAIDTRPIATGMLQAVTVTESRNYLPGWSIIGQVSNLTAAGQPISGTQFGWIPAGTITGGAKLGPPVAPGHPGFGSGAAVLAVAAPGSGFGTDTVTAALMLAIPRGSENGPYGGLLTISYVGTQPLS